MSSEKKYEFGWSRNTGISLHDKIKLDLKNAMVKKPEEITDDDLLGIIRGLVKSEKSVLELQKKENSPYLQVLESYLPRMVGREEVLAWINENIDFAEFKSPMQAMGPIMKHFGQRADGNMVKGLLQELAKG